MAKKIKVGDNVRLPYHYPGSDVVEITVKTINDVTGIIEEVNLIKDNGELTVLNVTNIVVKAVTLIQKIIRFFAKIFR